MKKLLLSLSLIFSIFIIGFAKADVPAFPGAEGFGAAATGGRGGEILHVTTLEDYKEGATPIVGSLRWALIENTGPRIVVFDVGGIIDLKETLSVPILDHHFPYKTNAYQYYNYTIAGQTAPGGITLKGGFSPAAHTYWFTNQYWTTNFIVRHIRVRGSNKDGDALGLYHGYKFILDHISISGGGDELSDASGASHYTVQWVGAEESCFGDQGVKSGSGGLTHNYGMFQSYNTNAFSNYHHTFFAHHERRNPYVTCVGNPDSQMRIDIRNCVVYNAFIGTAVQGPLDANVISNAYIIGHDKSGMQIYGTVDKDRVCYTGNIQYDLGGAPAKEIYAKTNILSYSWFDIKTETAESCVTSVLNYAGAWPRDATSRRNVKEIWTRTGMRGGLGPVERLAKRENGPTAAANDTDRDGMPDVWENAHGLNPNDYDDRNNIVPAGASTDDRHKGYTYVEFYLNELAENIIGISPTTYLISVHISPENSGIAAVERSAQTSEEYNKPYAYGVIEFNEEEYIVGSTVVMRAKPKPGYRFSHWEGYIVDGLTAKEIQFPAVTNVNLTAKFIKNQIVNIDVSASPANGGSVAGTGEYEEGDIVTLAAYSKKGYEFESWNGGPYDGSANPEIQFLATNISFSANFKVGNGGDLLIDDFNDQDKNSFLIGTSGQPKRWTTSNIVFTNLIDDATNFVATGGYNALVLGRNDGEGDITIPHGTTVLKFRVYNLDTNNVADVNKLSELSYYRKADLICWNGTKVKMWYEKPIRFPVIQPGESAIMEIPLAIFKSKDLDYRARAGEVLDEPFYLYQITGYYPKYRSDVWDAHVAIDNIAFGRASTNSFNAANLPPVAIAGPDQNALDVDGDGKEKVWIDASKSFDGNADLITRWTWTENGSEIADSYFTELDFNIGVHNLLLTVEDENGATDTDSVTITVDAIPEPCLFVIYYLSFIIYYRRRKFKL